MRPLTDHDGWTTDCVHSGTGAELPLPACIDPQAVASRRGTGFIPRGQDAAHRPRRVRTHPGSDGEVRRIQCRRVGDDYALITAIEQTMTEGPRIPGEGGISGTRDGTAGGAVQRVEAVSRGLHFIRAAVPDRLVETPAHGRLVRRQVRREIGSGDGRRDDIPRLAPGHSQMIPAAAFFHQCLDVAACAGLQGEERGGLLGIPAVGFGVRVVRHAGHLHRCGGIARGAQAQDGFVVAGDVKSILPGDRHMQEAAHPLSHLILPVPGSIKGTDQITTAGIGRVGRIIRQAGHRLAGNLRPPLAADLTAAEVRQHDDPLHGDANILAVGVDVDGALIGSWLR